MLETPSSAPVTLVARGSTSVGDMFRRRVRQSGGLPAMWEKSGGAWEAMSWDGFYDAASRVAGGLLGLGLEPGQAIGIIGSTRRAWAIQDMAGQLIAAVTFGIYPRQSVEQVRYLLGHSDCRFVFVESAHELETVLEAAADLPDLKGIIPWTEDLFESHRDRDPRVLSPGLFSAAPADEAVIDARLGAIDRHDTALYVYTSGTTGPPKAAMLTHHGILELLGTQSEFLDLRQDDISLSFLPMAHVAERILAFYGRICTGIATAYATSTATVLEELGEVRPTLFGSVPRIFEKAYDRIVGEVEKASAPKRAIFAWAVRVGTEKVRLEHAGRPVPSLLALQHRLADRLVFRKIRAAFGGRVRIFITGAAPIARPILELFWAANLPVYEAYGMTEATVATHINRPGAVRLGTVGKVVEPMVCRIAPDGEVLLRGPWIFKGYFKAPEATAEAVVDGWLHTGDIGSIDADGFLTITDRKKHIIITAGGKNIAPANIERALREASPLIVHAHAHGDRRPYITAMIAPSPLDALAFGVTHRAITADEERALTAELMAHPTGRSPALEAAIAKVTALPAFVDRIRDAVARANRGLSHVEQVKRFILLDRDFSQERGEVTPTMKLRRKAIETAHAEAFDRLYADTSAGHEPRLNP